MNKTSNDDTNSKPPVFIKKPFTIPSTNSTNSYDSWFENPNKPSEENKKENNEWNIDYNMGTIKNDPNPFSKKKPIEMASKPIDQNPKNLTTSIQSRNDEQYKKNIDFFMGKDEEIDQINRLEDTYVNNKEYLYENEVEDNNFFFKNNKEANGNNNEFLIYEEKPLPEIKQENLNVGSRETLSLVESDNELEKENFEVKDSVFKVYQKKENKKIEENNEDFLKFEKNNEFYEEIDLNQMVEPLPKKVKKEDSFYESKFNINSFPMFNFNYGWTLLQTTKSRSVLLSIETGENRIVQAIKEFQGPIKIEKNTTSITHTYNKLFAFINKALNTSFDNKNLENISKTFAWTILNEILLNKKISVFELVSSIKFKESLISFIESHFFSVYHKNMNLEEFINETNYLINLIHLSENQYEDLIEDNQWETIFFAKLFLSSQKTQELAKDVKEILINYIERTYKKFYPMYIYTLLKLGKTDKLYEENSQFSENPMLYLWFLLKLSEQFEEKMWSNMLQILFYQLNDKKKDTFLQFSLLVMCLGFDNENMPLLLQQNNHVNMVEMFETFFFLANNLSNFQYDNTKFLYKNLFPAFIIHAYNLLENGFHERAIDYVNLVESSRNFFFGLETNKCFMMNLREIKQRLIANVDILYSKDKNGLFLVIDNEKEHRKSRSTDDLQENLLTNQSNENDFSTNLKRNFYNYFNSALGMIKTPLNEMAKGMNSDKTEKNKDFYYDNNLKTWVLNGVPAAQEEDENVKKSKEKEKEKKIEYVPPPMMIKSYFFI